jgi:cytochrome c nitrite reductase small subunit
VAGRNDRHTPPRLVPKYLTTARNGFWHTFYFTTGTYHDPLRITARNRDVTERACRVCHAPLTDSIEPAHDAMVSGRRERTSCLRCHETVGHLE